MIPENWAESPPPPQWGNNFLTQDLSISGNFEQLWFWWQKSPPPPRWGNIFWHQIYPFQAILSNFGFGGRKPPLPQWGKIFWHQIYPFQAISSNFGFGGRKAHPPQMREKFLTPDLSISGNFKQLWFWWQKRPPRWGKIFWHQIYPFQAISSNFGFVAEKTPPKRETFLTPDLSISGNFKQLWFGGRKACPPLRWGKIFDTRSIHFRQFWATLVLVAEKITPMRENFLTPDISISGNFEQLWFWWQKRPPQMRGKFLTPDLSTSGNFKQLWFWWQKNPPPHMRENFWTPDLSISGNFEQLWFWWQKSPPQWGKIFWHQIYPFQGILSNFGFGGRKAHPDEGKFFDTRSIHFRQFWATLVLVAENLPSPDEGKIFDTRSIHFRQFWATLVLVQKSPPRWGKIFWHQIYPFQAILSNFGFGGRKAPATPRWGENFLTPDLSISGNFEQLWFWWQKSPLPLPDEGKNFDTRYIHFRQFQATLVLVAEKITPMREKILTPDISISGNFEQLWFWWQKRPPPQMRGKFLTPDLSISGNFKQLWFWWQKNPPPHMRENFWTPDLSISGNFEQLWFWWQKTSPPQMREKILTPDLSISGNFKQLWFWWQKSPPWWGKFFFDTRSIHFREFWATLVLVAEKPPPHPPDEGKIFWHQIYPFQAILSNFGFGGRKAPSPSQMREKFLTPDLSISGNFKQLWFWWQKRPPLPIRENFLTPDISISANFEQLWFWWQKNPPRWGKKIWHQIYPFQGILSNFGFGGRKAPDPPDERKERKIFWHQIYPFQAILSKFGFGGRKAPSPSPPQMRENFFDTRYIHFRQFQATLVLVAEKPTPAN